MNNVTLDTMNNITLFQATNDDGGYRLHGNRFLCTGRTSWTTDIKADSGYSGDKPTETIVPEHTMKNDMDLFPWTPTRQCHLSPYTYT